MIKLVIGLANPGKEYEQTRHNIGAWFIEALSRQSSVVLQLDNKLKACIANARFDGLNIRLAVPNVYMNHSGQTVVAIQHYYKIKPENTLIVHDDIDLPPGTVRLKFAGGEGGNNGLRSIVASSGSKNFYRLRFGVGHPGNSQQVANYVLKRPTAHEKDLIERSIHRAIMIWPLLLHGEFEKAMTKLHTQEENADGI